MAVRQKRDHSAKESSCTRRPGAEPAPVEWVDGVPYAPKEESLEIARRVAREDAELLRRLAK